MSLPPPPPPFPPQPSHSRRIPEPCTVFQRIVAWAVWPGALLLPVLLLVLRFDLQVSGWGAFIMMLFVLPVLELCGIVLAALVTARAVRVTPYAAGPWTAVLLAAHWVLLVVCALSIGDAGDTADSVVLAPLEQWGLPGPLVNALAIFSFVTTVVCALAAFIVSIVELVRVPSAPAPGAPAGWVPPGP